jgi:drug/metabolite transporter (DMT)-like permease
VLALATGALDRVSAGELPVFLALGAVGWASYLAFYGALAIGPISVLSPIVSGYAAVTVLLAVGIVGEHLSTFQAFTVSATIAGAMVASADLRQIAHTRLERRAALGFVLALIAMALLGGFVFGVSYYTKRIGWLGPIFLARGFTTAFLLVHVLTAGARPARWPGRVLAIIVGLALLDTGAYAFFNLGVEHAGTAIVAAVAAAYAIVPIMMGVSLFGERPTLTQWSGVGLVVAGVITLGAAA